MTTSTWFSRTSSTSFSRADQAGSRRRSASSLRLLGRRLNRMNGMALKLNVGEQELNRKAAGLTCAKTALATAPTDKQTAHVMARE